MTDISIPEGLQRLDIGRLVVGQALIGDVRDQKGEIVIGRGEELTPEHIDLLKKRASSGVYVGADWQPGRATAAVPVVTASPEELMLALRRRHACRTRSTPVRRYLRHEWRVRLRMMIQGAQGLGSRLVEVTTCDVATHGFSFLVEGYLHPGTIVYPRFESLPNRPVMKAVVRNCAHSGARQHRVGVEFRKLELDETLPDV